MKIADIPTWSFADAQTREANARHARGLGFATLVEQPPHDGRVAIVCTGPSAKHEIEWLKTFDGEIWAVNGALDWLISEGVRPDAWVGYDPQPTFSAHLKNAPEDIDYYVATCCDLSVFERLRGHRVHLWEPYHKDQGAPPPDRAIHGGTTCVTRAIFLSRLLGYRNRTVVGADSSFEDVHYVYDRAKREPSAEDLVLRLAGKTFRTKTSLLVQVDEIYRTAKYLAGKGDTVKIRCGGLMGAICAAYKLETE